MLIKIGESILCKSLRRQFVLQFRPCMYIQGFDAVSDISDTVGSNLKMHVALVRKSRPYLVPKAKLLQVRRKKLDDRRVYEGNRVVRTQLLFAEAMYQVSTRTQDVSLWECIGQRLLECETIGIGKCQRHFQFTPVQSSLCSNHPSEARKGNTPLMYIPLADILQDSNICVIQTIWHRFESSPDS